MLVYIISIVAFVLIDTIGGGIVNTISAIIGVKFLKRGQLHNTFISQFISTFASFFIASFVALKVFVWFDKSPKIFFSLAIYALVWKYKSGNIPEEYHPLAQTLGLVGGFLLLWGIHGFIF